MTFLLLHGGAGPASVAAFAGRLTDVIAPTHPGFDGTPRPAGLTTIRGLAEHYAAQLDDLDLDLDDVTVVGNSIGGWIAAELALLHPRRVTGLVLVDAVGIEVPGHPVADFFHLSPTEIAALSWADPSRFSPPPANPENGKTLQLYAGEHSFTDPSLHARLAGITVPTLVVWGEADGIADIEYGRAFAAAIPGAQFRSLPHTGHLPQLESPDLLLAAIQDFTGAPIS